MELFNIPPTYHYGIRIIDGTIMIPTKSVAEKFDMRHSNVMRACENARKHLSDPDKHYHSAKFNFGGKFNPGYYVSRGVFNIITKRVKDVAKRNGIDAYMRVLEESEASEPVNYHESIEVIEKPAETPEKDATPGKTDAVEMLGKVMNTVSAEQIMSLLTGDITAMLKSINEKLEMIIKANFADVQNRTIRAIMPQTQPIKVSNEPISVGELAKVLNQTGINIGEMRLFQWLREKEYLCAYGSEYNLPRQKYIEQGIFIIKTSRVQLPTGQVVEKNTTKVTAKGQEYFINKFVYQSSQSR